MDMCDKLRNMITLNGDFVAPINGIDGILGVNVGGYDSSKGFV